MIDFIKHFRREPDGAWSCISHAELSSIFGRIQVTEGSRFTPVTVFMGVDIVQLLEEEARKLFVEILLREPTYVGSYYHLAKLLERTGETDKAIKIYEKGMQEAKRAGDNHSHNELQGAYEDLV